EEHHDSRYGQDEELIGRDDDAANIDRYVGDRRRYGDAKRTPDHDRDALQHDAESDRADQHQVEVLALERAKDPLHSQPYHRRQKNSQGDRYSEAQMPRDQE